MTSRATRPALWGALVLLVCAPSATGAAPRITCAAPVHDFGEVDRDKPVRHTFAIRNAGDTVLTIKQVRACCGAATALRSKTVAPGSNTTLLVTLSLQGPLGPRKKYIFVVSDDPEAPCYRLLLEARVFAHAHVQPQHIDFGEIEIDSCFTQQFTLACSPQTQLRVTNCVSNSERFRVSEAQGDRSGTYAFNVATVPPFGKGVSGARITIMTDHPRYRHFTVGVRASVPGDIIVVPREILVKEQDGVVRPVTRYIAARSRKKHAFRVLAVYIPDTQMTVRTEPLGPYGYRFQIGNIMPFPDINGKAIGITTDVGAAGEIAVPIRIVPDRPAK